MDLLTAQAICKAWANECFGGAITNDKIERGKRVVEEALELGQAIGLTKQDCLDLVAYVFGRPVGEPKQEIAGVLVTILTLSACLDISAAGALADEIERISQPEVMAKIRKKQVSKEVAGVGMSEGVPTERKLTNAELDRKFPEAGHNPKDNCLADIVCPKCGYRNIFLVTSLVVAKVKDDGIQEYSDDVEWTVNSPIQCGRSGCKHTGTVGDFTFPGFDGEELLPESDTKEAST